jgi:putative copper resistance protein D
MTPQTMLVAVRFFNDLSLLLIFGTSLFVGVQVPEPLAVRLSHALCGMRRGLALASILAAILAVPVQTAMIGDGWGDVLQTSSLRDVIVSTQVGTIFLLQATGAALLLAFSTNKSQLSWRLTALVSGAMLATLAGQGHAVMQDGWIGLVHQAIDAIHVVSAGAWFGGLIPLAVVLRMADGAHLPPDASTALRRFSVAGHLFVAAVLVTGAANMVFILGLPFRWTTLYQVLLAVKIMLVGTMIGLALANRYVFVPALRGEPSRAIRSLRRGTYGEIALGTLVVLLVTIFGTLDPG